ncbi:hypothetical protein TWF730_010194 [Orbilia blumenaviensis]|uniref:Uncharacterized protein n=1 Tax=Orbilia blumenaviensis TaxID=1796055 RepID=A0AAV9UMI6_9PEZI
MDSNTNSITEAGYSQWFDSIIDYEQDRKLAGEVGQGELLSQTKGKVKDSHTDPPSNSVPIPTKKNKGRRHLSKSSKTALQKWFLNNIQHPYPSEAEKQSLSEETGLSVRQVTDWFANTRRRRKYKTEVSPALEQSQPQTIATTIGTTSPVPIPSTNVDWESMTPLDRWRHSPPDQEAAPLNAIADAVLNVDASPHIVRAWSFDSSESSFGTSHGSHGSSVSSRLSISPSIVGSGSESSGPLKTTRRRRRRYRHRSPTKTSRKEKDDTADRIYQCTFCTDTFKSKYDWTRHESALHLALEAWVCNGHETVYIKNDERKCIFCDLTNPTDIHLEEHNFDKCARKPVSARTFYRKDHLTQHLRTVHNAKRITNGMAKWKSKMDEVNCRCGFCGERFSLWSLRNAHIAEHFTDGVKMNEWKGCRGLDASVALLVENAIPPYLIGTEAGSFEPFRAPCKDQPLSDHETSDQEPPTELIPNRFEELTVQLSDYITTARETGTIFTDEDLRKEARIIMYGDDDPWNTTPADNQQWLEYFKQGHGISSGETVLGFPTAKEGALCEIGTFSADLDPSFGLLFGVEQGPRHYSNLPLNWRTPECLAEMAARTKPGYTHKGI